MSPDDLQTYVEASNWLLESSGHEERVTDPNEGLATLTQLFYELLNKFRYVDAALLCWGTELFDPRPRAVQMVWNSLMKYDKNLFLGASAVGKSFNMIAFRLLSWVHDPLYTNSKIVSTTMGHSRANTWSTLTTFHRDSVIPLPGVIQSNYISADGINKQAAIGLIAIPQGEDGKGRLRGFHPLPRRVPHPLFGTHSRVQLTMDEAEAIPNGAWEGVDNMLATEDDYGSISISAATNPKDRSSLFGQKCEPEGGWGSVNIETSEEWETREGWHVTRLDAKKTENVVQKKKVNGLQTYQGYMNLVRRGTNSESYATFARGWYPEQTAEYNIVPNYLTDNARGTFTWMRPPTPIGSIDPAFEEGGDEPIFTAGLYGTASSFVADGGRITNFEIPREAILVEQQFPIKKDNTIHMGEEIKKLCLDLHIRPEWMVADRTGNGTGLHDYLKIAFGEVLGIKWGESSTDKKILEESTETADQLYPDIVSEMLFSFSAWLEFGYIKFAPALQTAELFAQATGLFIADRGTLRPAEVTDRRITLGDRVVHALGETGAAVDIGPGGEGGVVPDPAERYEGDLVLSQPGRPGVLVAGVGQHEAADHLGGQQPFVLGNRLEIVLDGKGDDVSILLTGGDGQLHQEGVLDVAEPVPASGVQLDSQGVGLALTQ